jgi:ribosomal silencing factor RsfS
MLNEWFHNIPEDAEIQQAIIEVFMQEPSQGYSLEALEDIFESIPSSVLQKNLLLAKACFNNIRDSQIIQNTEGAWLLLDINTIMQDP